MLSCHIGTSIIIGVLVAKVVSEPVAILVLVVVTIVDYLSANREIQFYPVAVLVAVRIEVEGRNRCVAVITVLCDDDGISARSHRFRIISTYGHGRAVAIVYRLHLHEINVTLTGRLRVDFRKFIFRSHLSQVSLSLVPELHEVALSVRRRNDTGRVIADIEVAQFTIVGYYHGMIESGLEVSQRNGYGLCFARCHNSLLLVSLEVLIIIRTDHRLNGCLLYTSPSPRD